MPAHPAVVRRHPPARSSVGLVPALLVCLAAPAFFVVRVPWLGWVLLAAGMLVAWLVRARTDAEAEAARASRPVAARRWRPARPSLVRDLSLIALGLLIVSADPARGRARQPRVRCGSALALGGAVVVPYVVSRFVFRDHAIRFPWRGGGAGRRSSGRGSFAVLALGWLILPFYFITSGVYMNWPVVDTPELIARLFVGRRRGRHLGRAVLHLHVLRAAAPALPRSGRRTCCRRSCSCRSCGSSATRRGGRCSRSRSRCCRATSSSARGR